MRKILFTIAALILIFNVSTSQEKYKTSDFGLSNNVKSYNTFTYIYNEDYGDFEVVEKNVKIFDHGKLTVNYTRDNFVGDFTNVLYYTYDAQNRLIAITENNDYKSNEKFPYKDFIYENDKLIKSSEIVGSEKMITEYTYDKKGRIVKETSFFENKKPHEDVTYTYSSPNKFTKTTTFYNSNSQNEIYTEVFLNKLKVKGTIKNASGQTDYTYKYDEKGNEISQISNNKTIEKGYEYSKSGAILKQKDVIIDDVSSSGVDTNLFSFSEILYDDETKEGSKVLEEGFVKQFFKDAASYDISDNL